MRQLFPTVIEDIDIEAIYLADDRPRGAGRPWLAVNTATSPDGATAIAGRSAGIGEFADRLAFHALRAAADFIIVGAGTARDEHYGPATIKAHLAAARVAAGRPQPPRLVLVTRRLELDLASSLFTESTVRPLIATIEGHPAATLDRVREVADVVVLGHDDVDLSRLMDHLGTLGARFALVEGGPALNGQLVTDDLIDEWCLTLGTALVAGTSSRATVAHSDSPDTMVALALARVVESDGELLLRYIRA